jgi:hypothetical protein
MYQIGESITLFVFYPLQCSKAHCLSEFGETITLNKPMQAPCHLLIDAVNKSSIQELIFNYTILTSGMEGFGAHLFSCWLRIEMSYCYLYGLLH